MSALIGRVEIKRSRADEALEMLRKRGVAMLLERVHDSLTPSSGIAEVKYGASGTSGTPTSDSSSSRDATCKASCVNRVPVGLSRDGAPRSGTPRSTAGRQAVTAPAHVHVPDRTH